MPLKWIIAAALLVYGAMLLERTLAACCEVGDKSTGSRPPIDRG